MINESRKKQQRPYTVKDCVRKWKPLTRGIVGQAEEFAAWALEEEARFLNDQNGVLSLPGETLPLVFPLLRKVAPSYADGEMPEFDPLVSHFKAEADNIVEAMIESGKGTVPAANDIIKMIPPMAERLQGSIKTYKAASA